MSDRAETILDMMKRYGIAVRQNPKTGTWHAMLSTDAGSGQHSNWAEYTVRGGERYGKASYMVHKRKQRFDGETLEDAVMACVKAQA